MEVRLFHFILVAKRTRAALRRVYLLQQVGRALAVSLAMGRSASRIVVLLRRLLRNGRRDAGWFVDFGRGLGVCKRTLLDRWGVLDDGLSSRLRRFTVLSLGAGLVAVGILDGHGGNGLVVAFLGYGGGLAARLSDVHGTGDTGSRDDGADPKGVILGPVQLCIGDGWNLGGQRSRGART